MSDEMRLMRYVADRKGISDLMKSEAMKSALSAAASNVAARAPRTRVLAPETFSFRSRVRISQKMTREDMDENSLLRALGG